MIYILIIIGIVVLYFLYSILKSGNKKEKSAGIAGGVAGGLIGKSLGIAGLGGAISGAIPIALASAAMAALAVKAFSKKKQEIYKLENGDEYCGPLKDDFPHGYGVYVFKNGDQYVGEFKEGLFHGLGTFTWSNGDKYLGQFENDQRNGMGTFITNNGTKFEGKFVNNRFYAKENTVEKHQGQSNEYPEKSKSNSLLLPWLFLAMITFLLFYLVSK